ncbi:Uncharacterised protein [Salmonella enterica subsp. enterica serovar Bovismorbificans]|uniref:Uncharacterized protein n=1 Tax=Salmonella enterica subsp. enterica serovar Bovismorbificans TaxID=58097 RepID=A0A655CRR5_SALET|nr:Uncharacterised protein [Salmonella enterica subsp. enterica serovar Bovismorbificans]
MLSACKSCIVNIPGKPNGARRRAIFAAFRTAIAADRYANIDLSLILSALCHFSNDRFADGGMFGKAVALYA